MTALTPDLAIIGSGSGNSLVTPFWDSKRVVIAEKGVFGGTCLNSGCIPTKMFVRPTMLLHTPEEAAKLGVTLTAEGGDWASIRDRIFGRIDAISDAGRRYRDVELENVDLISQEVRLTSPQSFVAEDGTRVEAKQLVIAAGSRPIMPSIPGMDLPQVHTSDSVMRLDTQPQRIVIVGGGFIACEFAGIFSGLGSEVVQLVRGDELMRGLDADIRRVYNEAAERQWSVRKRERLQSVTELADGRVQLSIASVSGANNTSDGQNSYELTADVVLVAIGRRPNTDLIGAAEVGLDLHEDGRLVVDSFQRVLSAGQPLDGVYAMGDISSAEQLKHVANYQARVVSHNVENPMNLRETSDRPIPAAVFTHPELSQVGLTEHEAAAFIGADNVSAKVQQYGDTAYGWAMEEQQGIFKVVADRRNGKILGAHALGYQASNLLQPVIMAMSFGIDAHTAARGQYWIHPALMEVAENALLGVEVDPSVSVPL